MFFDKAIEKVKQMFGNNEQMLQKHEQELHDATNGSEELRIVINKKSTPCVCIFIAPGTDINRVQDLYEQCGIKMKKHVLMRGNRRQNILYITLSEHAKLDGKQKLFLKRTTTNRPIYKQNLSYAIAKDKVK